MPMCCRSRRGHAHGRACLALQLREGVSRLAVHAHGHALRLVFRRARRRACTCTWKTGATARPRFDATLNLARQQMTAGSLARALLQFPLITAKVIGAHLLAGAEAAVEAHAIPCPSRQTRNPAEPRSSMNTQSPLLLDTLESPRPPRTTLLARLGRKLLLNQLRQFEHGETRLIEPDGREHVFGRRHAGLRPRLHGVFRPSAGFRGRGFRRHRGRRRGVYPRAVALRRPRRAGAHLRRQPRADESPGLRLVAGEPPAAAAVSLGQPQQQTRQRAQHRRALRPRQRSLPAHAR